MSNAFYQDIQEELDQIKANNLYKQPRIITSDQKIKIKLKNNSADIINLCANNYLGLANDSRLIEATKVGLDKYGYGMSSVRFICGTSDIHLELEERIANYLNMEAAITYISCFDANGGLFESLLGSSDAIISDQLNHASIIDGVRLSKAKRFRFQSNDMQDLEEKLIIASKEQAKRIIIASDGVFSMDGVIANTKQLRSLADKYNAYLMLDDCHATGVIGESGRGSASYHGVEADIITGTFGKTLGGACGGFVAAKQEVIDLLSQKSRPYLFSNAIPPSIVYANIKAIEITEASDDLRIKTANNASYMRKKLTESGFDLIGYNHPIIPIMLYDEKLAVQFAKLAFEKNILVTPFSFPVVPKNQARIRLQISSAFDKETIDYIILSFIEIGKNLKIIK